MVTLKELAMTYESSTTKNIADLPEVRTDLTVLSETAKDNDGKEFTYKYVELNRERFRVPNSVIKSLKVILEENPNLEKFKVKKSGSGLDTSYTVIPLV